MKRRQILLACTLFALLSSLTTISQNFVLGQEMETEYGILYEMPLETVISRRMSLRQYDLTATVPWELVSKVLWAAYGHSLKGRTISTLSNYPIKIYVCNQTAAYKFVPESQSLTLWKQGDYRQLGGGVDAPIQLYIILDTNICPDMLWGNAESGCAIQNIYLIANALNLGTVCQYIRTDIPQGLDLPSNEQVLYKMPLGYPLSPYNNYQNLTPTSSPSSSELPEIKDSNIFFENALNSVFSSHEWSQNPVTKQELSQVLWAGYGYSCYEDTSTTPPTRHRTVPSAHGYYPMKVYAATSSGVYEYLPEQHTLAIIVTGDKRASIAQASGNAWASSAPLIIALAYVEDSRPYIGGEETYVEIGLIAQNIYLENAAWGLVTDWGKADANEETMRNSLGLSGQTNLHPVSIITVGHPLVDGVPADGVPADGVPADGVPADGVPADGVPADGVPADDIPPVILNLTQEPPENVPAYQNVTVKVNVTDAGSGLHNVTLWYSIDNGTTWTPLNMVEIATTFYQTTLPGRENGTWVTYKIIAYDNNGNQATDDNHGYCYSYHVVPEFQILIPILLALLILTLAIATYKRKFLTVVTKRIFA